jgi:exonuclease III
VLYYNVNGTSVDRLDGRPHWAPLFEQYDVLALQEKRSQHPNPLGDLLAASHTAFSVPAPGDRHGLPGNGVAFYVRNPLVGAVKHLQGATGGTQALKLQAGGVSYLVVNVYRSPSAELQPALTAIAALCQQLAPPAAGCTMVVSGDWNVALPPQDDRTVASDGITCFLREKVTP